MKLDKLQEAYDEMFDFITDLPSGLDGFESDFDAAYKELLEAKSTEVAPVVHAKWEVHEVDCFTKFATCTACGEYATDIPEEIHEQGFNITAHKPVLTRYCPCCGAKMDLKEDK